MLKYINYTCKDCGWKEKIIQQWADLKPKRCMNKKCKASFIKNPDKLSIEMPEIQVVENKEVEHVRRSSKRQQ